ncbi:MAG TPA: peptidylprolyl isomerase [Acholeplasma sp.]|nr:peptidylprolyl isomerase [Acholeplasma sp.]
MNILIDVLEFGEIEVELLEEFAPKTVANFIKLVEENYFQNSGFHRIIKGFMIQGGIGKTPSKPITGEFASNGFKNDLKHTRGVISMARTNDPNSASSQFFIMHEDSPHLDGAYAAFGKVTKGLDVVDRIANVKTNMMDGPLEKVVINNISLLHK